jgi:glycosyltransferase involved in cell wall biosynthesis
MKYIFIGPTESVLTKRGDRFPQLATYFAQLGEKIEYISTDFYHAEKRKFTLNEVQNAVNKVPYKLKIIKVCTYKNNTGLKRLLSNLMFAVIVFNYLLRNYSKEQLIVFLPSRQPELIYLITIYKRIFNCKIYLDVQDIWPDALITNSKLKKISFEVYCDFFNKRSLPRIDKALIITSSFHNWLNRYNYTNDSILAPLGFDNKRWKISPSRPKSLGLLKFVCVAQLQRQIDIMPFLKAMNSGFVGQVELTIIGESGAGERYEDVKDYIVKNEINVDIKGLMGREELATELLKYDIGLISMKTNSLPNKVFDFVGCGLPIYTIGDNDISLFVNENNIGWYSEDNVVDIVKTLGDITDFEIDAKRKSLNKIRNRYNREVINDHIYNYFTNP